MARIASVFGSLPPLIPAPVAPPDTMTIPDGPLARIPQAASPRVIYEPQGDFSDAPVLPKINVASKAPQMMARVPQANVQLTSDPLQRIEGHAQNKLEADERKDAYKPTTFGEKLAHALSKIGNVAGDIVAPNVMARIPGTDLNREVDESNQANAIKTAEDTEAGNAQKVALAGEENAQADNLRHPPSTPLETSGGYYSFDPRTNATVPIEGPNGQPLQPYVKPGNRQHIVLKGPDGNAMLGFVDPTTGITTDAQGHTIANPVPFEKPTGEHPTAGTVNGTPAFGVWVQGKGWQDPNTGQPMPNFQPPPPFSLTGMWQPTEGIDPKTKQLVPGMLNERTGEFRTTAAPGGGPAALPKDVTSELGKELQTAREADKRLRIMQNNETEALKGDQQAMLSLVANHIGMTLGAQKGARINQAVWDEAVQSAPWLQNVKKHFGPGGVLDGVTLSPEQIKQMVDLGKVVADNQWKQAEQAYGQYGIPIAPHVSESTPEPQKTIVQHSASTGQYRYSTDGGKTWQAGKPKQ